MGSRGPCRGGVALTPTTVLSIRREYKSRDSGTVTPERLIRDAMRLLQRCGIARSPKWAQRVVRDYIYRIAGTGFPFGAYLLNRVEMNAEQRRAAMNDPELACLLEYADPTGETAVRNVTRAGS